jgi:hypothetical protein
MNKASQYGFQTIYVQGSNFKHTVYKNKQTPQGLLHVYLGGDGSPWFEGRYITRDPTPLKSVMLDLMKLDKTASIYLGRPCYHQSKMPANCDNSLWTNKRYSHIVVDSMVMALKRYSKQHNIRKISLFGFSGGGTLAMLIAPFISEIDTVITLAGNLDTDAWIAYHDYAPLTGSLNPSTKSPLPTHIKQLHLLAKRDKNMPAEIIKSAVKRQNNAQILILDYADHHCCWVKNWKKILGTLHSKRK